MPTPLLKPKPSVGRDPYDGAPAEHRARPAAVPKPAPRFTAVRTQVQFDSVGSADYASKRRRAFAILGLTAVIAIGMLAALAYLVSPLAAAAAALAAAALVGFGNWVLDNTFDL